MVKRAKSDKNICSWCEAELARTGRRRCRKCNATKPIADFNRDWCKPCKQRADRVYRARDKDKAKPHKPRVWTYNPERRRATYLRHREKNLARDRRWQAEHREHVLAQKREWHRKQYEANPNYYRERRARDKLRILRQALQKG